MQHGDVKIVQENKKTVKAATGANNSLRRHNNQNSKQLLSSNKSHMRMEWDLYEAIKKAKILHYHKLSFKSEDKIKTFSDK